MYNVYLTHTHFWQTYTACTLNASGCVHISRQSKRMFECTSARSCLPVLRAASSSPAIWWLSWAAMDRIPFMKSAPVRWISPCLLNIIWDTLFLLLFLMSISVIRSKAWKYFQRLCKGSIMHFVHCKIININRRRLGGGGGQGQWNHYKR